MKYKTLKLLVKLLGKPLVRKLFEVHRFDKLHRQHNELKARIEALEAHLLAIKKEREAGGWNGE